VRQLFFTDWVKFLFCNFRSHFYAQQGSRSPMYPQVQTLRADKYAGVEADHDEKVGTCKVTVCLP